MMSSLFSVFDPTSNIFSNWMVMIFVLIFLPLNKWLILSKIFTPFNFVLIKVSSEFKMLVNSFIPGILLMFLSLLYFIFFSNMVGLFPYIFTSTSHLLVTVSLSFTLWLSFNLFGWLNNLNFMMAHLVPMGTPMFLMNFMVIIETISSVIRPLTLSIRLSANMIAGHLLLSLLGNIGPNLNFLMSGMLLFAQIILLALEIAVAIIQSYVFSILSILYISEVN